MEAIKLKLNLDKLRLLTNAIEVIKTEPTNHRDERVARNILNQVYKKLAKKKIDVFPKTKDFQFKLFYYEADSLEKVIRMSFETPKEGQYAETLMRIVADEINQKLA